MNWEYYFNVKNLLDIYHFSHGPLVYISEMTSFLSLQSNAALHALQLQVCNCLPRRFWKSYALSVARNMKNCWPTSLIRNLYKIVIETFMDYLHLQSHFPVLVCLFYGSQFFFFFFLREISLLWPLKLVFDVWR